MNESTHPGGQIHEQKLWSAYYDNAQLIVYMISLVDYAFNLDRKSPVNRLLHSLHTLEELTKVDELKKTPFVICFTKVMYCIIFMRR